MDAATMPGEKGLFSLSTEDIPMFAMAFTAMHTLDEHSPLFNLRDEPERMLFMLLTLRGIDGRTLQPVFARAMYSTEDLRFGVGFAEMVSAAPDGVREVDATRLDALEPRALTKPER